MRIEMPENARKLIAKLNAGGFDAHVVGGCVRDSLMGITPHDWDICTAATPDQMKNCFQDLHVIETGIQHGTLTVMLENEPFEVTTYRIDGEYLDNRRPEEVVFVHDLREDLSRRDFTINAMAYNDTSGLVDPFGGEADLQSKIIKCVGEPDKRFNEDALRLIRALRFSSVFGFDIASATGDSIHKNRQLLNNIAAERINAELGRLLCGSGVLSVLRDYADVVGVFIPEIVSLIGFEQVNPYHIFDVWEHTIRSVAKAPDNLIIRLAMLLHDIGKPSCFTKDNAGIGHFYGHPDRSAELANTILKRLRYDNRTAETVKILIKYHDTKINSSTNCVKRLLNKMGPQTLDLLLEMKLADYSAQNPVYFEERALVINSFRAVLDRVLEEAQCFALKDLAIDGRDLIEIGIPQGTEIGVMLKALLDMVMSEAVENKKEILLKTVKMIKDQQ